MGIWSRLAWLRPWLFLAPAAVFLIAYGAWPVAGTIWRSLHQGDAGTWVGLAHYAWFWADPGFVRALANTALWLLVVPALATALGLMAAHLSDGLRWGWLARAAIFLPTAISFTGAAVIWKFVYDYRGADQMQVGLLNALRVWLGAEPLAFLSLPVWNSLLLMAVLIWAQTGFAMVILHAALRATPPQIIEAAQLDGAGPWRLFWQIRLPQIRGALAVVWTAITIMVLKVFDIVHVMTNGQWGTQVLATQVHDWLFRGVPDYGRGSAVAVVLMALVLPLMLRNLWAARARR